MIEFALTIALSSVAVWLVYRQSHVAQGESVRAGSVALANSGGIMATKPTPDAPASSGPPPLNTVGVRNNNPGNIRDAGIPWQGKVGRDSHGFVVFSSPFYGLRAIALELKTSFSRGDNSILAIISEWAPPTENNTKTYVNTVSKLLGLAPVQALSLNAGTIRGLMKAIVTVENGANPYADVQYDQAIQSAGIS